MDMQGDINGNSKTQERPLKGRKIRAKGLPKMVLAERCEKEQEITTKSPKSATKTRLPRSINER